MATRTWIPLALAVVVASLSAVSGIAHGQGEHAGELFHIHGVGFSTDGGSLLIPSHFGLAVYRDGRWSKAPGPQHDYMGFAATSRRLYSSGHPAAGSGLVNPFGLMRSDDAAKTWTKLGLEGEADFHLLAAGFMSNAVYVYNAAPNKQMSHAGIYRTLDDGRTWQRADAAGLEGSIFCLAVHPTDANTVAVGTGVGLFVSEDAGVHFTLVVPKAQVPGLMFDHDGTTLWVSTFQSAPKLLRINWKTRQAEERPLPIVGRNAIAYMAQHPSDGRQLAVATFERDVFLTRDGGTTWKQIADHGRTLQER